MSTSTCTKTRDDPEEWSCGQDGVSAQDLQASRQKETGDKYDIQYTSSGGYKVIARPGLEL